MEDHFEVAPEPKKEWVAPELKKIDVEDITAQNGGGATDAFVVS
jgi:hypothetical protein